jgi:hypothetical protein
MAPERAVFGVSSASASTAQCGKTAENLQHAGVVSGGEKVCGVGWWRGYRNRETESFGAKPSLGTSLRLPPAARASIIVLMKKFTISRSKRPLAKAATKPISKPLVAVRKAAQKPVHATRSAIRRAVRSVAEERHQANA